VRPLPALFTLLLSAFAISAADKKPNVILIVGDDMGYADVGFHGCKEIPTPHLDALAKSGVRFTNGYVSGPYCSPTRAGLLTGRYQTRFGHEFNPGGVQATKAGLPLTESTIADRMKAAGYRTALIGKWHLGTDERHPQKRGFDDFFGFLGGAHDYFKPEGVLRGSEPADEKAYLTDALGREAVSFIDKNKDKPFFLYLAFNAVHTPMQADDPRLKKFAAIKDKQRQTYAAMMSALDDAVGIVVKKLADEKLTENTLVAFISDNGGPTMQGTTINASINTPLRGSKRTTLEGGIRVPFVVSWPGKVQQGTTDDRPVIQLDLHVTALAAAGVAPKAEWHVEGVDLLPYLSGKEKGQPHAALYWRFGKLQWCWAHLKRDFQALIDSPCRTRKRLGHALMRQTEALFGLWKRVRDGTLSRRTFRRRMQPIREKVKWLLLGGYFDGRTRSVCKELWKHREHLWTFVDVPGVEPTNNAAERALRHAVIWRKLSFGTQSAAGSRFVERMLTVIETCRRLARNAFAWLTEAVRAAFSGRPTPPLLAGA
jgi:arylsulfatase A-like enzyme